MTMPLQVSRAASAAAIWPCGSSLSSAAISAQGRSSTAAVFAPSRRVNSSVPSVKRLAASICQTKRKGKRCGRASAAAGLGAVGGAWTAATIAGAAAAAGFAAAGCWPAAVAVSSSVKALPAPSLSNVTGPAAMSPLASPLSVASRASLSAPSAIRSRPLPKRCCAEGVISISSPSAVKIAAGSSISASRRCARSGKLKSLPARSVETTSTPAVLSASAMRVQMQMSVPPKLAPKPRRRSSRGAPPCGSVPASRAIWAAAGWLGSNGIAAAPAGVTASKIAAALGLAQRMAFASVLHSHTGDGLRACAASRGSVRQVNWNSAPLITFVTWITTNESLRR